MTSLTLADVIGFLGVFCVVGTYCLSQLGRMDVKQPAYPAINAVGAVLILYSLTKNFNAASVVIEFFWLGISLMGLFIALRNRR